MKTVYGSIRSGVKQSFLLNANQRNSTLELGSWRHVIPRQFATRQENPHLFSISTQPESIFNLPLTSSQTPQPFRHNATRHPTSQRPPPPTLLPHNLPQAPPGPHLRPRPRLPRAHSRNMPPDNHTLAPLHHDPRRARAQPRVHRPQLQRRRNHPAGAQGAAYGPLAELPERADGHGA